MQGLVLSLRSNGFIAYVPAFDAKGPVYISDRDGQVQVCISSSEEQKSKYIGGQQAVCRRYRR